MRSIVDLEQKTIIKGAEQLCYATNSSETTRRSSRWSLGLDLCERATLGDLSSVELKKKNLQGWEFTLFLSTDVF